MQCSVQRLIAAPRETVFAIASDIPHWPEVVSSIEHVEMLTPGPVAAGSRFGETRLMHGRAATEEMTVAELTPPERFVLTAENHGTRYRMEYLFEAEGAGTRLRLVFSGEPATLAARLLAPLARLMRGQLQRQLAADLADLAHEAERAAH
jgi:hypothetical protein